MSANDYAQLVLLEPPERRRVLICFDCENYFEREVLAGILQFSQESVQWRCEFFKAGDLHEAINNFSPEGVIFVNECFPASMEEIKIPSVHISPRRRSKAYTICMDDDDLGLMAADYMFSRSPRHYIYCGARELGNLRQLSFEARLNECGVGKDQVSLLSLPQREAMLELLNEKSFPVAIYCEDDIWGRRVIDWLSDEGISVPQKVIVLGTGDDPLLCNACVPALSSMVLRFAQGGYDGAKQLQELMEKDDFEGRLKFIVPKNIHERASSSPFSSIDPRIVRSMQYYLDHMDLGQNVEEVCRFSELSYRSFHRLFKDSVGVSPKSWMEMEQFKRAKNLLENSREKLSVVAKKCGYTDDKSLIRSFRRLGRHNPSHYRKTPSSSGVDSD
jgi:LacI family transcriptional regulator